LKEFVLKQEEEP
jgi:hypothetical protein